MIKVRDGTTEWGWGVVVNVVKNPSMPPNTLPSNILGSRTSSYIVDTLLHCASGLTSDGPSPEAMSCSSQTKR
jgi:ATP-dependent RNA helicase DOB1